MKTLTHKQAKRLMAVTAATMMMAGTTVQTMVTVSAADEDTTNTSGDKSQGLAVTPDATKLNAAVKNAEEAGVKVTQGKTKTTTVSAKDAAENKSRIDGTYADKVKELTDLATKQKAADTQYAKDEKAYKAALEEYNAAVKGQTDDANPSNPLQPEQLAYEQPFNLTAHKSGLSSVSVTSTKITDKSQVPAGDMYNSNYVRRVKITDSTKPITVTYKNVAKDKESGKSLNVTLTLSDFVTDKIDTQGSQADATPYIYVYSNYADAISQFNVVAMKQATTYTYADSNKTYNKEYYQTYGSLNYQDANRYEFTSPASEVKASFLNKGTSIANKLQKVSGKASTKVSEAFMGPVGSTQPDGIWDTSEEALTRLGVTYLVENGASVWLGVSGGDGKDPVAKPGDGGYWATYNHIMMGTNTVAPTATKPVEPKKPATLKAEVQLENLLVTPEVTKDVDAGNNKGNADGTADGKIFMKGDKMTYSLDASALPAGRDTYKSLTFTDDLPDGFKYTEAKAFDKDGKDVTADFKIEQQSGHFVAILTDKALAKLNAEKSKQTELPTISVYGVASKDGVTLDNAYQLVVDGQPFTSNTVENNVVAITPHKDVKAGVVDTLTNTSIDGKAVVKGQALTYTLHMDDLPANRATDITDLVWSDKLPKYVDYAGYKVLNAANEDVTDNYEYTGNNGREFSLKAKSTDALNADKTQAYVGDHVVIYTNANQDGVNFKNTATLTLNDQDLTTNTVKNLTPNYHPEKLDLTKDGKDFNGKSVKPGDTLHYQIKGDLSEYHDLATTVDQLKSDDVFTLSDDYDEDKLTVNDDVKKSFTISLGEDAKESTDEPAESSSAATDSSDTESVAPSTPESKTTEASSSVEAEDSSKTDGTTDTAATDVSEGDSSQSADENTVIIGEGTATEFDMNDVTVTWDLKNGRWSVTPKDNLTFLQKYAGKTLIASFEPIVKDGATGIIENTATQTTFGQDKQTNTVKNPIKESTTVEKETKVKEKTTKEAKKTTKEAEKTTEAPEKQLPNTGSNGPLQRIVNWFMALSK